MLGTPILCTAMTDRLPLSSSSHAAAKAAASAESVAAPVPPAPVLERRSSTRLPREGDASLQALAAVLPGLRWLIGLLIASVIIAALYFGRDILIPLALAVLLGFLLDPAVTRLKRWGLSRMVATLLVVVLALGALTGMGFYLGKQVQSLSADLPTYQNTIKQKLRNLRALSSGPSVWDGAIKTYSTVESEIAKAAAAEKRQPRVQQVEVVRDEPKPLERVVQWLDKVSEPVAMIGIVLLFVILILLDRDGLRDRLLRLMGGNLHVATDALDEASDRIGKYLRMQFVVNVTYGIPMAAGLWLIGVPGAFLWGVLATIMRFVPYVGPMISAVFPLALAFAVAPGWDMLLWTLGLILLLELISNNVIEPWLYGSSTGLSTLAIIMAATFWTALWGPIGLILSTPLTVCCLVLGRYLPGLQFMEVLLGSEPVLNPPQRLYQRLLADDVNGAIDLAHADIAQRLPAKPSARDHAEAVAGFYAEVGVPSLQLAYKHHTENATAEHRRRLSNGLEAVLEELAEEFPAAQPSTAIAADNAPRVLCVGARWEMDALAADMVAHSLQLQGVPARSASHALTAAVGPEEMADWGQVQWLVLSTFHAQPQALVRQILRRVRRRYPQLQVVLALWNGGAAVLEEGALARLGADAVATSVPELLLRMAQLMAPDQAKHGYVAAALPEDDAARVQFLEHSGALLPVHTPMYKEAALKAANAFNVKYAQVSLVGHDWVHTPGSLLVRASAPDAQPGLPRDISICSYVVRDGTDLVVEDVARDPRFSDNPALADAAVKFYAGVPLVTKKGYVLGTLCIMHDGPRSMADDEMHVLHEMAEDLMARLRAEHLAASGKDVPS